MVILKEKEKINKYFPLFYELGKEKGLNEAEIIVYGYVWNVCNQLNDEGYCGYSNERMAQDLGFSLRSFCRHLATLVEKELVLVSNAGRRTKKAGESRELRINPLNYITAEVQISIDDELLAQKDAEIKALQEEIAKLKATAPIEEVGNWIVGRLYKKGFFTTEEYNNAHQYNVLFDELLKETDWSWCEKFCMRFDTDPKTVSNKYNYICSTVKNQIKKFKDTAL